MVHRDNPNASLFALLFVLVSNVWLLLPHAHAATYGNRIVAPLRTEMPPRPDTKLEPAIEDLQATLEAMTGQEYSVARGAKEYNGPGIFLVLSTSPQAPADAVQKLKGKGREPFVIRSSDDKNLWLVANGEDGLSHGVYFYLDQLGVRYYFPNQHWTIIPHRQSIASKVDRLVAPAFKLRSFAGTGGLGPRSPVDSPIDGQPLRMQTQWRRWTQRNRFGGEYYLSGHTGEAFNMEKKAILLEHPEYLAKVDGKYVDWSQTAKLNTANPDAVKLYVDWSVERFRRDRRDAPNSPYSVSVSVDPADGGGFCNSPECEAIGGPSEQAFYIANLVAREIRKEFPDGYVNLYAYADHAAVPKIPLEPNIIVSIIPYAFQSTGLSPEEFISTWGKKAHGLNIYDYWSITDWALDMPSFDYIRKPADRIPFWHQSHIEGFNGETTYSAGAMGLGWYLASKLMWDPSAPVQPLIEEFYEKSFGPAKAPMKRMLERWSNGFHLNSQEIALSFADMNEAMRLAADNESVRARLDDYAGYMQYLRLHHEYMNATNENRQAARLALLRHIWSIYDSAMVHTFRLYQFLVDFSRDPSYQIFDIENPNAAGWKEVAKPTHPQLLATLQDGARTYRDLGFRARTYEGELVTLKGPPSENNSPWSPEMIFLSNTEIELEATAQILSFPLRVANVDGTTKVDVLDRNNKVVFESTVTSTPQWRESTGQVQIKVPLPGHYLIRLRNQGNSIRVQAPPKVRLLFRTFLTNNGGPSPRLYFYVPVGLKTLAISQYTSALPHLYGPDGKEVTLEMHDNGLLLLAKVPAGQDGKVWALEEIRAPNGPLYLLNAPHVFSFFPDTLMVPTDALKP